MAGRPLRPATDRRLGVLLPPQLADGPQPHLKVIETFSLSPLEAGSLCGISLSFDMLSRALR